jgi:Holliday junction resolvase RusA-like endonuclease
MAKNFSSVDLEKMGVRDNGDGTFSKVKKVVLSPGEPKPYRIPTGPLQEPRFRTLKLTLFGEPMAKQSVRQGKNKEGKKIFYQKKVKVDRKIEYQAEIRKQLPKDFVRFETCVFIKKLHFMFSPLKSFHHEKGKMEAIRNGKKYYKNSRPDMDNLQKLVLDSMSEIVFSDDGIIVGFEDMKKYYGIGGCVIIELEGY